jgi:hypothetical protein
MTQQPGARRAAPEAPTPAPAPPPPVAPPPTNPALAPRTATLAVDESSIEVEIMRHSTAIGAAPAPRGQTPGAFPAARPTTAPPPYGASSGASSGVPAAVTVAPSSAIPAPIVVPPSGAIVAPMAGGDSSAVGAASAARTMLADQGASNRPTHAPGTYTAPAPTPAPAPPPMATTQAMSPLPPVQAPTRAMQLSALPPGAMEVPLTAIAPTISPDAGHGGHGGHGWHGPPPAAPEHVALHGHDLRKQPEYIAATAAYQAAVDLINPVPRGTPGPHAAAEGRRSGRHSAGRPAARRGSPVGTVLVLLLCAAAAVGGFFLVQHLM